jgi:hypothetical protein
MRMEGRLTKGGQSETQVDTIETEELSDGTFDPVEARMRYGGYPFGCPQGLTKRIPKISSSAR